LSDEKDGLAKACKDASDANSTLIVFLSGHGVTLPTRQGERNYFCPVDGDPAKGSDDKPYPNLIDLESDVIQQMGKCTAAHKYLFVDACRDDPSKGPAPVVELQTPANASGVPKGVLVIYSCDKGQKSKESAKLKHGVFSYFLVRGLSGLAAQEAAEEVTFTNLVSYVQGTVPNWVKSEFPGSTGSPGPAQRPKGYASDQTQTDDAVVPLIPPGCVETVVGAAEAPPDWAARHPNEPPIVWYSRHVGRRFENLTFTGTFKGVNFNKAVFVNCRFVDCKFRAATKIDNAKFQYCTFEGDTDFKRIETRWVTLDGRRPTREFWAENRPPDEIVKDTP
jgi:hypothetical protein